MSPRVDQNNRESRRERDRLQDPTAGSGTLPEFNPGMGAEGKAGREGRTGSGRRGRAASRQTSWNLGVRDRDPPRPLAAQAPDADLGGAQSPAMLQGA